MGFNDNLNNNYSQRGSSGGKGHSGGGGTNPLMMMLMSSVARKFGIPGVLIVGAIFLFASRIRAIKFISGSGMKLRFMELEPPVRTR